MNSRDKGAKGERIKIICSYCGKEFTVRQCDINHRVQIKYCSSGCYHKATRKTETRNCVNCGKEFVAYPCSLKKFCDTKCSCEYRRKQPKKITVGQGGYKYIWLSDGTGKREHVVIMEEFIGRKLDKTECVHHIDFNRQNNDIENLQLMTISDHSKLHRRLELENGKALFGR